MSEWITDRLPDPDQWCFVDTQGKSVAPVYVCKGVGVSLAYAWMPVPKPYQPPQPDTSLAASIERYEHCRRTSGYHDFSLHDADLDRIIEAASKWNEYISNAAVQAPSNDPDGVGEGWRLLREGEVIQQGDQYFWSLDNTWRMTNDAGSMCKSGCTRRRRRIDADKQEGQTCDGASTVESGTADGRGVVAEQAGEKPATNTQPTEQQDRREWLIDSETSTVYEVLPGDPDPEWVDELVRLCERLEQHEDEWHCIELASDIADHLKNRGEK